MSDIENIKLLVDLTNAKVSILRMKADPHGTWRWVDEGTAKQLEGTLIKIDEMLESLTTTDDTNE